MVTTHPNDGMAMPRNVRVLLGEYLMAVACGVLLTKASLLYNVH